MPRDMLDQALVLTLEQIKNIIVQLLRTLRLVPRHLEQRADVSLALARPWLHICQAEAGTEGKDKPGWDTYIQPTQGPHEHASRP